jgi:DNA polymerase elongation subunit (family B)
MTTEAPAARDRLVNATYDGRRLHLYGRTGEHTLRYPDGFYIDQTNAERLPPTWLNGLSFKSNGYFFCRWPEIITKKRRQIIRQINEEVFLPRKITVLEADVDPVQRFLAERKGVELADDWRILFLDLETADIKDWSRVAESRVLSFGWYSSSSGQLGYVRTAEDNDLAEAETLRKFVQIADEHDVIVAWNGDDFDFEIVINRCRRHGIRVDPRLKHFLDHLKVFRKYWQHSEDGAIKASLALENVGQSLLGRGKVPISKLAKDRGYDGRGNLMEWVWRNAPDLHREYQLEDVELMRDIEDKTKFIQLHFALARICKVLPGRLSLYPSRFVDGKMLQRGAEVGYHFPTKWHIPREEDSQQAIGAYVPPAILGLHKSVAVVDFAKMYVSFIRSFNMSPETLDANGDIDVPESDSEGNLTGRIIARFRSNPIGHIPAALGDVIRLRSFYKDLQKKAEPLSQEWHDYGRLSDACKVIGNIFYGVILSIFSRYHVQAIGESITSCGRIFLKKTKYVACEKRGYPFVLGDTDSVGFVGGDEEAIAVCDEMNNEVIPEFLKAHGVVNPEVLLEYEKRFSRLVVTASKRYAGKFVRYQGTVAKPDAPFFIRGLEIVRSDVCKATRKLQREVIDMLLKDTNDDDALRLEIDSFIRNRRMTYENREITIDDHLFTKGLSKPLAYYATNPPQVRIAKKMIEQGMETNRKIPIIHSLSGAVHPDWIKGPEDIDVTRYWNQYVYEPTKRVLEAVWPKYPWISLKIRAPRKKTTKQKLRETHNDLFGRQPIVLQFDGEFSTDVAQKLKSMLAAFPGGDQIELWLKEDGKLYQLKLPMTAIRPENDDRFDRGLKSLGFRWK